MGIIRVFRFVDIAHEMKTMGWAYVCWDSRMSCFGYEPTASLGEDWRLQMEVRLRVTARFGWKRYWDSALLERG
jgi:hypothetical protein